MPNDYYNADDLPQRFGQATAEAMGRRLREISAGFDKLPGEDRLKRGLVGTGADAADDPDTVQVVTGDVPYGSYVAYTRAQSVGWIAGAANTGAVTIAVDGGPVVALLDSAGQPLVAGHLQPGLFVRARFTGTAFAIVEATAVVREGDAGTPFTRAQVEQIVREVLEGGTGGGSLVLSDVERVTSAAELAAVNVLRRWACVVVDAPFSVGGESYRANDVLVWDNIPDPGRWVRIYTEPPASVLPGGSEPLGALVAPQATARLTLLVHVEHCLVRLTTHKLMGKQRGLTAP